MEHSRISVADDYRLVRAMFAGGLREANYEVLEACDEREAADLGCEHKPDLAILDLCLPHLSGIEAACELHDAAGVPFIFLSGYSDEDLVKQATEEGALGYVVKPIELKQLLPTIEAALERAEEIRRLKKTEDGLAIALGQRRKISVAIGILAARNHLTADEAFEALRNYARSTRRKLSNVATELVKSIDHVNDLLNDIAESTKSHKH